MSKVMEIYRDTIRNNSTFGIYINGNNISEKQIKKDETNDKNIKDNSLIKDKLDVKGFKENNSDKITGKKELSDAEKKLVEEYKRIDRKVRAHEAAHRSAGAGLVRGGTTFKYEVAPDNRRYAVAGEVKIDLSYDLDDPAATIRKMQQVRRAALAPSDPSPQDRAVATKAANIEARARRELQKQKTENSQSHGLVRKVYIDNNFGDDNLIGSFFNSVF